MFRKYFWEVLNPKTCIICDLPTGDTFLRRSELLRFGCLEVDQRNPEMTFLHKGICRHCLINLPIIFPINSWPVEKSSLKIQSLFLYENPIDKLILWLKFYHHKYLALYFAHLFHALWHPFWFEHANSLLLPIPLGKKRLAERGFNQVTEIANHLTKLTNIQSLNDLLIRSKETLRQTETKSRSERLANLSNAFQVNEHSLRSNEKLLQKYNNIILLDDISTTGVTLIEAAKPLQELGFSVKAIVVASEHISAYRTRISEK